MSRRERRSFWNKTGGYEVIVHLPILRKPEPPLPSPFAVGTRVMLRCCAGAHPGVVTGLRRGKIIVDWPDLHFTGRHKATALIAADQECPATAQQPGQDALGGGR
jgi:hypothetical protein